MEYMWEMTHPLRTGSTDKLNISWIAKWLSAFQVGLCSIEFKVIIFYTSYFISLHILLGFIISRDIFSTYRKYWIFHTFESLNYNGSPTRWDPTPFELQVRHMLWIVVVLVEGWYIQTAWHPTCPHLTLHYIYHIWYVKNNFCAEKILY
jgi:hypothetical protein